MHKNSFDLLFLSLEDKRSKGEVYTLRDMERYVKENPDKDFFGAIVCAKKGGYIVCGNNNKWRYCNNVGLFSVNNKN